MNLKQCKDGPAERHMNKNMSETFPPWAQNISMPTPMSHDLADNKRSPYMESMNPAFAKGDLVRDLKRDTVRQVKEHQGAA